MSQSVESVAVTRAPSYQNSYRKTSEVELMAKCFEVYLHEQHLYHFLKLFVDRGAIWLIY